MALEHKIFSFAEACANSDGKTSGSGTMGILIIVTSSICFLYGCFEFHYSGKADIMLYSSANIAMGAGLLGYRKSKGDVPVSPAEIIKEVEEVIEPKI